VIHETDNMNRFLKFIIIILVFLSFQVCAQSESLTNTVFVAFDVETTGLNPLSDRIVEIAAIKFKNSIILESKSWLINPGIPIPESTTKIHGITDKMVENCPLFKDVFPDFAVFIEKSVLVAHNAEFDIRFITVEAQRNSFGLPYNTVIDNLKLSRHVFPDSNSYDLKSLAGLIKMAEEQNHRALSDSKTLMNVFLTGLKKLPANTSMEQLIEITGIQNKKKRTGKSSDEQSR
jgi:DNA polymerase III epsilon subunit family exonuclease